MRPNLDAVIKTQRGQATAIDGLKSDVKSLRATLARLGVQVTALIAAIASAAAESMGIFVQAGIGAIVRGAQDKARESVSVTDYLEDDTPQGLRTAIDSAMAYLVSLGGGTLLFPKRADDYQVDNTGLGAILWQGDHIHWDLDGGSLENISTDLTGLIDFDGVTNSIQWCSISGKLISQGPQDQTGGGLGAGPIFGFASKGLSYFETSKTSHVLQRNSGQPILTGTFVNTGGMFENIFRGIWEHGTEAYPPTVSGWYIRANKNLYTLNIFTGAGRLQLHSSTVPFFDIECTSGGAYFHQNGIRDCNIEQARGGIARYAGCMDTFHENVTLYDSHNVSADGEGICGHLIRLETGSGGQGCVGTRFVNWRPISGDLLGVLDTDEELDFTAVGDVVTIESVGHARAVGECVYVDGTGDLDEGRYVILDKTADDYDIEVPGAPASGSATVWTAAMDVVLDSLATGTKFRDCPGTAARAFEVDLRNRQAEISGHEDDAQYYRYNPATSVRIGIGSVAGVETPLLKAGRFEPGDAAFIDWSPSGYLSGLRFTWVSVTTVRIEAGRCRSDDDTSVIDSASFIPIDIATSGAGGLDTGSEQNSKWYKCWIIWGVDEDGKVDSGVAAAGLLSVDSGDPVMPSGYNRKRFVGRCYNTSGGDLRKFKQRGAGRTRTLTWDDTEVNCRELNAGSATTLTDVIMTGSMPPESQVAHLMVGFTPATAGNLLTLVPADFTAANWTPVAGIVAGVLQRSRVTMNTSSGQRVAYKVSNGGDDAWLYLLGFDLDL
jgi:hypothetical protein